MCENGSLTDKSINFYPEKTPLNLKGKLFKVGAVFWPPNVIESDFTHFRNTPRGIETRLLQTIARAANFTYIYKFPDSTEDVGMISHKGNATGLMKMLLNNEVEIIIGSLNPTINRHKFFDFSVKFGSVRSRAKFS